jgi:hypothetical protein
VYAVQDAAAFQRACVSGEIVPVFCGEENYMRARQVRVRATYLPELGLVFTQTVENAKKSRFRLNLPEIEKVALGAFK